MWCRYALVLCMSLLPLPLFATEHQYLQQLVQQSRDLHLAERIEWLNLLHYKPYPFWPGSRSLADDPGFFNAPTGKTNAAEELEATLSAFFSSVAETDSSQNPQCRFVARFHWLHQQLKFDPARLELQPCKRFEAWRLALNPHELTLVFPSAYLNSPASMYGHTLLRIDAKDQDEQTRLLAYTIGYLAATNEDNGFIFAYKGLAGGYPGTYSTAPYYLKVREYNDLENRDIWEYRLNFSSDELEQLVRHIWEMGPTRFDYYFLDENCSYNLLSLLEVARPDLRLTDAFRWWAIPSDTVREVTERTNLLKSAVYRPSNTTVITQRLREMQPPLRNLTRAIIEGKIQPNDPSVRKLAPREQAQILELSADYLTYLRATKGDWPAAAGLSRALLIARSGVDEPATTPVVKVPETRPDQGHQSLRVGLGFGSKAGSNFQELTIRPAYHDQNDPGAGYIRGAQIQFFNLALRHYENGIGNRIEEFVPIDIFSLSPRNDFFHSLSWKVNAGWTRQRVADGSEPLLARLNVGIGHAWDAPSFNQPIAQFYTFIDATLEGTDRYAQNYALGFGPAAGVITDLSSRWRVNVYARAQRFGLGEPHTRAELTLTQRYSIGAQTALRLEMSRKSEFDRVTTDAKLSLHQYF
jgi:Domain of unknown function (DUF4105)